MMMVASSGQERWTEEQAYRLCLLVKFPSTVGAGGESWKIMKRNLF